MRPRLVLFVLFALLLALAGGATAQTGELQALIELRVDAGYDGHFRELEWLPVRVSVVNNGPEVSGRLVVRPETSGDGITNTFSAPVVLPQGAQQTIFLYITARAFANLVRVELLSDAGAVLTSGDDLIRSVRPGDRIAVVFTDAPAGGVSLSGAALGGFNVFQADWSAEQLPPLPEALAGIDLMLFDDMDTGAFSGGPTRGFGGLGARRRPPDRGRRRGLAGDCRWPGRAAAADSAGGHEHRLAGPDCALAGRSQCPGGRAQ